MGTVFVRGSGGSIFEMDVPAEGTHNRDLYEQKLENGDLAIVPAAEWVDVMGTEKDGKTRVVISQYLRAVTPDEKPAKAPKAAREPKAPKDLPVAVDGDTPAAAPTKKELIAHAADLGVELQPKMTNSAIQAAIDAHLVAGE